MKTAIDLGSVTSIILNTPGGSQAAINRCVVKEARANILVLEWRNQNREFQKGTLVKMETDRTFKFYSKPR